LSGKEEPMGNRRFQAGVLLAIGLVAVVTPVLSATYSQDQLIEDVRQLTTIIEASHPDPFLRCGGRIAFYRIVDATLNAIPKEGMTKEEFVRLLRPLIATIGDAHTQIWSTYRTSDFYPGGIPLRFSVVGTSLYVTHMKRKDERLHGARLISVQGCTLPELMALQRTLVGLENDYEVLLRLSDQSLWYAPYLAELLPDWTDHSRITVKLHLATGEIETVTFELPVKSSLLLGQSSSVGIPEANSAGFGWGFMDVAELEDPICYLRIDHQGMLREFREENRAVGAEPMTPAQLASIPSATGEFRDMVVAMAEARTDTLIIDLRYNSGGTDTMADILVYFLYGHDGLISYRTDMLRHSGGSVMRYSALHFENCPDQSIEDVNARVGGVSMQVGDYDFSEDTRGRENEVQALLESIDPISYLEEGYRNAATFYEEFMTGTYAGYYVPERVVVLVTPKTFSAGSTTMRALDINGATLIGTPSGQSMNAFGNGTLWKLGNTGVHGCMSRSYHEPYADDPELGHVWPVDVQMTYDLLASYAFDPNAELLLALDWLRSALSNPKQEAE